MAKETKPPPCPACGRMMTLARSVEKEYAQLNLNVFECLRCRDSYMVAKEDDGERAP